MQVLYPFSKPGHGDSEPLAVFCHCPSGYLIALVGEFLHQRVVAQGFRGVFGVDEFLDGSEYLARGGFLVGAYFLVEEEFQRINAPGGGDIFSAVAREITERS